jgi:xanthine permease
MKMITEKKRQGVDEVNEVLPFFQMLMLAFQHVLTTYSGFIAMPMIICAGLQLPANVTTMMISSAFLAGGIAIVLQSYGIGKHIGIKMPLVLGCSAGAIGPLIGIGSTKGVTAMFGAVIVAGVFSFLFAPFYSKLIKLFPPIVTGTVTLIIGLVLTPIAVTSAIGNPGTPGFANPKALLLTTFVIAFILLLNKVLKGYIQNLSILIALVVGTVVGGFMGLIDYTGVSNAQWFAIVKPFALGAPTFEIGSIISLIIVSIIVMLESTGAFFAVADACNVEAKAVDSKMIANGIRAEGLASIIGGALNSFTYTTFVQNVSLVTLTGIRSRFVVVLAGVVFMIFAFIPKLAAVCTMIPAPVFGAAMLVMFSTVAFAGIKMLREIDMNDNNNMLIIAVSVGIALGTAGVPGIFSNMPATFQAIFGNGGIILGSITAVVLNVAFNFKKVFGKDSEALVKDQNVA